MISAESRCRLLPIAMLGAGCIPEYSVPNDSSYTDAGEESQGDETTTTTGAPLESTSTRTTTGAVDDTGMIPPDPTNFIESPDLPPGLDCDFFENECPRGQKCMPYAWDGGAFWNASKCTPIARNPVALGEPCVAPEGRTGGVDDCAAHAMCWNVDSETEMGECVSFCDGSPAVPSCIDPLTPCTFLGESVPFMLCLPQCDPVAQDCDEGMGCYPHYSEFLCMWDISEDGGAVGDLCEHERECDPGLVCIDDAALVDCESPACCSPFCELGLEPSVCSDGLECVPWYEFGDPPPQFEHVGVCRAAE